MSSYWEEYEKAQTDKLAHTVACIPTTPLRFGSRIPNKIDPRSRPGFIGLKNFDNASHSQTTEEMRARRAATLALARSERS